MKVRFLGLGSAALALSLCVAAVAPAQAQMGSRMPGRDMAQSGAFNNDNRGGDNRFERRGNSAFYNNHRGYSERREGYRYYNGFWFPPAAFVAGAIIGGLVANQGAYGYSSDHVQWCEAHYRSYRAYDDTFQPYNGPRQVCVTPFG